MQHSTILLCDCHVDRRARFSIDDKLSAVDSCDALLALQFNEALSCLKTGFLLVMNCCTCLIHDFDIKM